MTITEFCDYHGACASGRDWALANCINMPDAWEQLQPEWLLWVATRDGVLTTRARRLFAVWCARQVQHLVSDPIFLAAINVAERHANGEVTDQELYIARAKARVVQAAARGHKAVYNDARWANEAAINAACAEGSEWLVFEAARDAANSACWHADRAAVVQASHEMSAARFLAYYDARQAQSDWLRANTTPNFEAKEPSR